jgi:hypothetical protein
MHEALPRLDATHLKRGGNMPTKEEDGRAPRIAVGGDAAGSNSVSLLQGYTIAFASWLISTPCGNTPVST